MIPLDQFSVHDVTDFPLVRMKDAATSPGYAAQWVLEMETLLSLQRRFVMLHDTSGGDEAHEDRKERGIWLKHHKAELGRYCLAMIGIEADRLKRQAMAAMSAMATKAFGIPTYAVESPDAALLLAQRLLGPGHAEDAAPHAH